MIRVSSLRWPIEQCFQEGKSEIGMDHYEHRSWPAWHRHMTFVFLAQLFLLKIRHILKKTPALTLPQTCLLMKTVLPLKRFNKDQAIQIIRYYQIRNYIVWRSHRKSSLKKTRL